MSIPFVCVHCGKSATLADAHAGKKIKCKCGRVSLIEKPMMEDPLVDFDDSEFEPFSAASSTPRKREPTLSRREREDRALAEKLGEDWKDGPKSDYFNEDNDDQHWIFDALDVLKQGLVQAFWGFALGSVMLCFSMHMLATLPIPGGISRAGRTLGRIYFFFIGFSVFTSAGGLIFLIRGFLDEQKRSQHSKLTLLAISISTCMILLFVLCFSIWIVANLPATEEVLTDELLLNEDVQ